MYPLARPTKQESATLRPTPLPAHRGRRDAQNDAVVDEEPNPAMTDPKPSVCTRALVSRLRKTLVVLPRQNEGRTPARDSREGVEAGCAGTREP